MKTRTLRTREDVEKASKDLLQLTGYLPIVITLTEGTAIRSHGQNARYWASLTEMLEQIAIEISQMSDHTGYTSMEMRRLISQSIPPEHAALLWVRTPEAAHEILKIINDIPTSTRLGTKEFSKYEGRMEQTLAEVLGEVRAYG